MIKFHSSKVLPFKQEDLFNIVIDVEQYPKFLPYCKETRILSRDSNSFTADLAIKFKFFHEAYRSNIIFSKPNIIQISVLEGPLSYLNAVWKFTKQSEHSCQLEFYIDFALKSIILKHAIKPVFNKVALSIIDAFEKRAHSIYGSHSTKAK